MLAYLKKAIVGAIAEDDAEGLDDDAAGATLTQTLSSGSSGATAPLAQTLSFMSDEYQQTAQDNGYGPPTDFPYSYGDSPRHDSVSAEICRIVLDEKKNPTDACSARRPCQRRKPWQTLELSEESQPTWTRSLLAKG